MVVKIAVIYFILLASIGVCGYAIYNKYKRPPIKKIGMATVIMPKGILREIIDSRAPVDSDFARKADVDAPN